MTPNATDITIPAHTLLVNGLTIKGDAGLIPDNIKKGIDLFGVAGMLVEGFDFSMFGYSKYSVSSFQLSKSQDLSANDVIINHTLGTTPQAVIIYTPPERYGDGACISGFVHYSSYSSTGNGDCIWSVTRNYSMSDHAHQYVQLDSTKITLLAKYASSQTLLNKRYCVVALA